MSHYHAVVWLDNRDAHVMHFTRDDVERFEAHASDRHPHLHHKRGSVGSGHKGPDATYFDQIVKLLDGAQEVLVVGPGSAKLALIKHIHKHHHDIEPKIMGVESVDHPSDGQLVSYARNYFLAKDRMLDQGGHVS